MQSNRGRNHSPCHSFVAESGVPDDSWIHMNLGIMCDICSQENFTGKRYQCQTCLPSVSFDACSSCLPKVDSFHPRHEWAFVPNPSKIHANRILIAKRAIALLNNAGSNGGDRDDATGWRMSDAQKVLAVEKLGFEILMATAVAAGSRSESLFDGSILDHSFNTLLHQYRQALAQDATAADLERIRGDIPSLSVNQPIASQLRTHGSPSHISDPAVSQRLQDFLDEQRRRDEGARRKLEAEAQERIREQANQQKRRDEAESGASKSTKATG